MRYGKTSRTTLKTHIEPDEKMGPKGKPKERGKGADDEGKQNQSFSELFASPKKASIDINKELLEIADKPHSYRYFHAPIKGHPDYKDGVLNEDGTEPSQVIISGGQVIGVQVDPEVVQEIENEKKTTANLCQCCRDIDYEVGKRLKNDLRIQASFISRILLLECILRIPAFLCLIAQRLITPVQRFIYSQYLLVFLSILVFIVVIVWSVKFSDLGRQYPCNNILLFVKAGFEVQVSCTATAITERLVLLWRTTGVVFDELEGWEMLQEIRLDKELYFSYPVVVPLLLINVTFVYILEAIFFKYLKGNIKKDRMLWFAVGSQLMLSAVETGIYIIIRSSKDENKYDKSLFFVGPSDWDILQIMFPGVIGLIWELWRLYDLRETIKGKRFDVDEYETRLVVLNFSAL